MKHKIWINFVVVLALALGSSGTVTRERPGALAAPTEPRESYLGDAVSVDYIGQIGGQVNAVAVAGQYAYVGEGFSLTILDISAPGAPAVVSRLGAFPGKVMNVAVSGNYAYITDGMQGNLRIINVSDPAAPIEAGFFHTQGDAVGVAVAGNYAYVADGIDGGLRIINVAEPTAPAETGYYDTSGAASSVAVAGNYAYVADGTASGLRIIDISDPAAPTEAGFYDTPGSAADVAVAGNYAYVADGIDGGLRIIAVSDPTTPTEIGHYDTPGTASSVAVAGNYAYVADGTASGLRVIAVSDPASPTEVGHYETPGSAVDVAVAGGYACVADGSGYGVRMIDVSDPANPSEVGSYETPGSAVDLAVAGGYAYVAGEDSGLRVIDVSNPASPSEVAFYDTPGSAVDVALAGAYAYVADGYWGGLRVIDVSDPANPSEVGSYDTPEYAYGVAVAGAYAYVADGWTGLLVIDVSDPASPDLVGSYDTPGSAWAVAVAGAYAYVADWFTGLRVIDVSNPASPSEVGFYDTPGDAWDLAVVANYAYIADGSGSGLRVIDVGNPANPSEVGFYDALNFAYGVAVAGGYASVADYASGLSVINVSDPANPSEVGSYDTPGIAYGVALAGDYAYVADEEGGLIILKYTGLKAETNTVVTSDAPDPSHVGQPILVSFEVTAPSGIPTGTVSVTVAETGCTGSLVDGLGSCEIPTAATTLEVPGTYSLLATYSGDDHFLPSSAVEEHTRVATSETTSTILSDNPDPSQVGQAFTVAFEVTAESGTPSGVVHVQVAGEAMDCFGTLAGGIGQCEITLNVPGAYTLTAAYAGDNDFLPSSAVEQHQVGDAPAELSNRIFLPNIVRDYCPDFFDDFSNPSTGWETGEDEFALYEYLNGEYRILSKNDQFIYLSRAPTCWRENYIVEVDARWVGTPGASYGIVFGIEGDYRWYYTFEVNTDYRDFGVWLVDGDNTYTIVPITPSNAINGGTATNHLKVIRSGTQFTLEINGVTLGTWSHGNIPAKSGVGILSVPYDGEPASDARFDNFSVSRLNVNTLETGNNSGAPE